RVERIESTLELLGKGSSQVRDSPRANLPSTFSQSTDQNDGREIADGPGDGRGSECQDLRPKLASQRMIVCALSSA
ncbi:hypothetical protein DH86_00004011, partial [Scytalidium sp. 3C]